MKNLSTNFTLAEATNSQEAERRKIDNTPDVTALATMTVTAQYMEMVRAKLSSPILVSSWYRCKELNRAIGSKDSSQHLKGEAVDFISPRFGTPKDICLKIWRSDIDFDQLILEHSWVHISFAVLNKKPRRQVLSLLDNGYFAVGLTNSKGVAYHG